MCFPCNSGVFCVGEKGCLVFMFYVFVLVCFFFSVLLVSIFKNSFVLFCFCVIVFVTRLSGIIVCILWSFFLFCFLLFCFEFIFCFSFLSQKTEPPPQKKKTDTAKTKKNKNAKKWTKIR